MCEPDIQNNLKISLKGGNTTEPGTSLSYTATVTNQDGSSPTGAVTIRISLSVDIASGGHDHGEQFAKRSKGRLSTNSTACHVEKDDLVCSANSVAFDFGAPAPSGTHHLAASCDRCSSPDNAKINVKVDKLEEIPETMAWVLLKKPGATHSKGHYLNAAAMLRLRVLAGNYNLNFPRNPFLHLNDASLVWGGLFDVHADWKAGYHTGHRLGKVIDIRANDTALGAIPERDFIKFRKMAAGKGIDVQTPHCSRGRSYAVDKCVGDEGRHFHVLLLGVGEDG